jgi:hypothetical protein
MDLDDIRRNALAARQFTVQAGACSFTLQVPTRHEASVAYTRVGHHGGDPDSAAMVRWQRAILVPAVVGWSGVLLSHVLPDEPGGTEPLPWEPAAVELVLDAQPEWDDRLTRALVDHLSKRRALEDTAAKN